MVDRKITCGNCGAEYPVTASACPYCGAENKAELLRLRKEDIREYEREQEKIKSLPKHYTKKGTKIVLICLASVLLVFILVMAVGSILRNTEARKEKNIEAAAKETMEQYYQEGKYLELYDYYVTQSVYSPSFQKYWEVGSARNWMEAMDETKEALDGPRDTYTYYGISYAFSGSYQALRVIEEAVSDGVSRGNEDILEGFRTEIMTFFREDMKLTEEEIGEIEEAVRTGTEQDWDAWELTVTERLGLEGR